MPSGSTRFLICSDAPEILDLPWELMLPPGGEFLRPDSRFAIRSLLVSDKMLADLP